MPSVSRAEGTPCSTIVIVPISVGAIASPPTSSTTATTAEQTKTASIAGPMTPIGRLPASTAPPPGPPVALAAPAAVPGPAPAASPAAAPSAEQLQRFLDQVKDDPEALARRQSLVARIKQGDPAALARWQQIMERRRDNNRAPAQ